MPRSRPPPPIDPPPFSFCWTNPAVPVRSKNGCQSVPNAFARDARKDAAPPVPAQAARASASVVCLTLPARPQANAATAESLTREMHGRCIAPYEDAFRRARTVTHYACRSRWRGCGPGTADLLHIIVAHGAHGVACAGSAAAFPERTPEKDHTLRSRGQGVGSGPFHRNWLELGSSGSAAPLLRAGSGSLAAASRPTYPA